MAYEIYVTKNIHIIIIKKIQCNDKEFIMKII